MVVNGENVQLDSWTSLAEYVNSNGYNPALIAVELNGDIVPKANYDSIMLNPEDTLEIVQFVGGG